MNEIALIFILLAMAFACIIWLLFENKRIIRYNNAMENIENSRYWDLIESMVKTDEEIGSILAKLENLDTRPDIANTDSSPLAWHTAMPLNLDTEKQNETTSIEFLAVGLS